MRTVKNIPLQFYRSQSSNVGQSPGTLTALSRKSKIPTVVTVMDYDHQKCEKQLVDYDWRCGINACIFQAQKMVLKSMLLNHADGDSARADAGVDEHGHALHLQIEFGRVLSYKFYLLCAA